VSGQASPRSATSVFMFNLHGAARACGQGRMDPRAGLDTGFFVGGEHVFVVPQGRAFPFFCVQVQEPPRFFLEEGIAGKYPATVLPRTNGILVQPPPDRTATDRRNPADLPCVSRKLACAPSRKRCVRGVRRLAGQRFNLHDHFWEEKTGDAPAVVALPSQRAAHRRSACATCKPLPGAYSAVCRSHRWRCPRRPSEPFRRAEQHNTATYTLTPCAQAPCAPRSPSQFYMGSFVAYGSSFLAASMPRSAFHVQSIC